MLRAQATAESAEGKQSTDTEAQTHATNQWNLYNELTLNQKLQDAQSKRIWDLVTQMSKQNELSQEQATPKA